ncbi:MAG: hypothetical protein IPK81_24645 [Rhodospirillales bacterium]|nr:MAG: hypothetical protein IPK81_24645 [Rhodospirillales bacterium]
MNVSAAVSPSDAAGWFARFKAFGLAPGPDTYAALFHPEGEVADAGMAAPTPASAVREAIAHVLRLMPDLRIDMRRYRGRGAAVFVEAANSATINGVAVAWESVYRVHLRDGGVFRGRRFYDQAAVFRALRPDLGWLDRRPASSGAPPPRYADIVPGAPVDAAFTAETMIGSPDRHDGMVPAELRRHLGDAPFELVDWAGDDGLAFVEWRHGDLLGVDRLDLADGVVTSMRRHFDTLGLLAARDPSVAALRASLLSNAAR